MWKLSHAPVAVSRGLTFVAWVYSVVFFRARTFGVAARMGRTMLGVGAGAASVGVKLGKRELLFALVMFIVTQLAPNSYQVLEGHVAERGTRWVRTAAMAMFLAVVGFLSTAVLAEPADFIYFQF
jgi:hypothetical protein